MQKKAESLFVGLCLMAVAVLCGIAIGSSYTEKNIQTTYSVAADRVPAVLRLMDENVKESISTISAVAENTVQVQKEMLSVARANAEILAEEQVRVEAEALAAEQARAEAEAIEPEQAETVVMPAEVMVTIEDEETATAAITVESAGENNPGEADLQEKMTASELMQCINAERSAAGMALFNWSDELAAAAGVRSVEAVSRFEHVRPDGSDFFTVSELAMAENLARGDLQTTAQEIVDKWMESTGGHRQNILDSGLYTIGIAIYEKDGQLTICALFG